MAAAQCCQVLWVCFGYDGMQDLVREVKEIVGHFYHSFPFVILVNEDEVKVVMMVRSKVSK